MAKARVIVPSPLGASSGTLITSPFQFAVSGEDNLRVRVWFIRHDGGVIPKAVVLSWRAVDEIGRITIAQQPITPGNNGGVATETFIALSAGFIQNLTVTFAPFSTFNGLCYVTVDLVRGLTSQNATLAGQLIGGYIRPGAGQAWPGSPVTSSVEGRGLPRVVDQSGVILGSAPSITQDTLTRWRLTAAFGILTTDATAGTRNIDLEIQPPVAGPRLRCPAQGAPGPSVTHLFSWMPGGVQAPIAAFNNCVAPLPERLVTIGPSTFTPLTSGMAAGDSWTEFRLFVEEWLECSL